VAINFESYVHMPTSVRTPTSPHLSAKFLIYRLRI